MPRKPKGQKVSACVAHGQRCALAGASGYRSDRCEPAEVRPRQLDELFALMGQDPAERQRLDSRPLAVQDAEHGRLLRAAEAQQQERERQIIAGRSVLP